jgi:G3E family GTPase
VSNDALLTGRWRIPVFTLTGFLGSGKTSLLVRLLREPGLARTAIVVNEFGDVGIDQLTLREVGRDVRLLEHGCLCCTTREDLLETLRGLYMDRLSGAVEPFERVIVETSGMADPIPVIHTLMVDPLLQERFVHRGTVVAIDLTQPLQALFAHDEGARQVAAADAFVMTKRDLPDAADPDATVGVLRRLNPDATASCNDDAEVAALATAIADEALDEPVSRRSPTAWMLEAVARARQAGGTTREPGSPALRAAHRPSPVESFVLVAEGPAPAAEVSERLQRLVARNATRLLRLKGVVEIAEHPDPVVVHAVRNLFHPGAPVRRRPQDRPGSRLVLIVDNPGRLPRGALGAEVLGPTLFEACEAGMPVPLAALGHGDA